jgi:hypothetical protein
MAEKMPVEKLYLQLDKPYYALSDTLRFKAYLFNADLTASTRSGLLYVELDDINSQMVKRILVPVISGVSWGDIALDEALLPAGSYTLRAYTNWMLNFGEDYVFKKNLYITALSNSILVNSSFKLENNGIKDKIQANLLLTGLDHNPSRLKQMQLRVMNGKRTLFKNEVSTEMDGRINLSFDLADKAIVKSLAILSQEVTTNKEKAVPIVIPVILNRPENTDLQFLPEGGQLVAGIQTKVAFKAVGEDGRAVQLTGKIYDSHQQEIALFQATHKGMGSFELTPQAGENYIAKVTLAGNVVKTYPLPLINLRGTAIRISLFKQDSLAVILSAAINGTENTQDYYLIGQAHGVVCYAAHVNLSNGLIITHVAKNIFPNGVARFTLLNAMNQPLNERMIYIDHDDELQLDITPNKAFYGIRDSVSVQIRVKDKEGNPVAGNFSIAVTDDGQVHTDSLTGNIITNLLLTEDLKGTVEDPAYYFGNKTAQKKQDLDNLLLTQGWVGYDWKTIFNPKPLTPKYNTEPEYVIKGRVTNLLNKPVEKSSVVLFSKTPRLIVDTLTDRDGIFKFKGIFPVDTAVFKLTSHNKRGKSNYVSIEMLGLFKPPVFTTSPVITMPWYVNSDTLLLNNATTKMTQLKAEADFRGEGKSLKEVIIKDKRIIKDSKNLNGPGGYDQALDEQELVKLGNMTLEDLLATKIKDFQVFGLASVCPACRPYHASYIVHHKLIQFIIDGISLSDVYPGGGSVPEKEPDRYNFITSYTKYITAQEVKGIEIMTRSSLTDNYISKFNDTSMARPEYTYIEITTRSGKGPYMSITPGTTVYRPLPFTLPKEFYSPRYTIKNAGVAIGTDLRSTIHWKPNIFTDKDGIINLAFFSADIPANYTITVEGTDFNGGLGYSRKKLQVKK